jgi:hypothetical protein
MASHYLDDLIYKLLSKSLTDGEKRRLESWYDVANHIDEESREDMKDALFEYVLDAINYASIIRRLQAHLNEEEEGEKDDDDDDGVGW